MVGKLFQSSSKESDKNIRPSWGITFHNSETIPTESNYERRQSRLWHLSYIPLFVILILLFLVVLLPLLDQIDLRIQYLLNKQIPDCQTTCSFEIVESIPDGLVYTNSSVKHISTFETWKNLIGIAQHSIQIGSFYWSLSKSAAFPTESKLGDEIFNALLDAGLNRNISIEIAQNKPTKNFPSHDTSFMQLKKAATVKFLDFDSLIGSGILHTKFWIVDKQHVYIGSANLDWRSLTQVKELGIAFYNCSCVAEDLSKIFDVYWMIGNQSSIPNKWPDALKTDHNLKNPLNLNLNGEKNSLYITSSPPQLSAQGRTDDIVGLIDIIKKAKKFVHVSVMNYLPLIMFSKHLKYWPIIDNELKEAVINRNVQVRLLISEWRNSRPMEINFLKSLVAVNKYNKNAVLEIKLFKVPSNQTQSQIPFARVNHNKYMVTDNGAFIGTSNWSGDYFISTAGVSVVSSSTNKTENVIQKKLKDIFDRDWFSPFAHTLLP